MKNESSKKKSKISTPKKVALAILGALTLLTIVNLIEAGVNRFNDLTDDTIVFEEEALQFESEEDIHIHIEHDGADHSLYSDHNGVKVHVQRGATSIHGNGEVMIDRLFDVDRGDLLSVQVGDADVQVRTHRKNEAHVTVALSGKNMKKARAYFEDLNYEVVQEGEGVHVFTKPVKKNYSWDQSGGANITIDVVIPETFNTDIRTSDGDINVTSVNGQIVLHTSDGDVTTASLKGPEVRIRTSDGDIRTESIESGNIHVRTSDGDINMEDLQAGEILVSTSDGDIRGGELLGSSSVSTSDGDIYLTSIKGPEVNIRTSDGEIVLDNLFGESSKIQTSDGSIVLREVSGALEAKTSSGDLRVTMADAKDVYLRTGDGNIQVDVSPEYAASLFLKGERVRVSSAFSFQGDIKEGEAEGKINGGGYRFEARTSDGEVIFREN